MTENEIWRAAYLMLQWYGATAQQESARRAEESAAAGDPQGEAGWRRVVGIIGSPTPPPGPLH